MLQAARLLLLLQHPQLLQRQPGMQSCLHEMQQQLLQLPMLGHLHQPLLELLWVLQLPLGPLQLEEQAQRLGLQLL